MRKTRTWIVFAALAIMGTACGSSAASTGTPSNTKDTASATDTSSSADTAAAADTAGADTVAGPNLDSKTQAAIIAEIRELEQRPDLSVLLDCLGKVKA